MPPKCGETVGVTGSQEGEHVELERNGLERPPQEWSDPARPPGGLQSPAELSAEGKSCCEYWLSTSSVGLFLPKAPGAG